MPTRRLLLGLTSLGVALLAGGAGAHATRVESESLVDQLLDASGITRQLEQVEPGIRRELSQGAEPAEAERLLSALKRAYEPQTLRETVREVLERELPEADMKSALAFLRSDRGRRITRLEEAAGEEAETEKRERDAADLLAILPEARVELYRRLGRAIDVGELNATLITQMTLGMAQGMAALPGVGGSMIEELRDQLRADRPKMVAEGLEESLRSMAHTYRALPDEDLVGYAEFAESALGRRYHRATSKALERALEIAAGKFGLFLSGAEKTA